VTSYTVQPSDFTYGVALENKTTYTIEIISVLQTRNGSTTNLSNNNVSALSRVYSSFQTLPTGTPPVNLPTVTRVGNQVLYTFDMTVQPGIGVRVLAQRGCWHDAAVLLAEPAAPVRAADISVPQQAA
jgi:hypothetical protein